VLVSAGQPLPEQHRGDSPRYRCYGGVYDVSGQVLETPGEPGATSKGAIRLLVYSAQRDYEVWLS
jgi:hypothetical protein